MDIEENSPEKRLWATSLGSYQVWSGFPSSIVEIDGVFSIVYFIVSALIDCSLTIFVMSG